MPNDSAAAQKTAVPPVAAKAKPAAASPLAQLKARATQPITGLTQAAVLMFALGEKAASEVFKHLDQKEVIAISAAMQSKKSVARDEVEKTLERLEEDVGRQTSLAVGADDYVRRIAVGALGETKAGGMLDSLNGRLTKGLDQLKWMDSRNIAELIGQEHPQIIALALAHLDPEQAGKVLQYMPTRVRSDALMRIASLDGVQPHALNELDEIMDRQLSGNTNKLKSANVGGLKQAADILNGMDGMLEHEIMQDIRGKDAAMGGRLEEMMFTFDDLAGIDDRSMQALLRELNNTMLVTALKGADDAIMDAIFKNMSSRAADALRDDIKVKAPVRVSEVNIAQKEILAIARKLADAGTINLSASSDEMVL